MRTRLALLIILLATGCSGGNAPSSTAANAPPLESSPAADQPPAGHPGASAVPIRLASWEETEQLIASKQGKVVVLDVWSTWCVPCVREFPGLVALQEQYGDQVACMSLNCNYTGAEGESPEDSRAQIENFLTEKGAHFENVISTTPDEEILQILGAAAVPIVRVYDKQGKLRKQFVNDDLEYGEEGFTYDDHIAPLVEELLSE